MARVWEKYTGGPFLRSRDRLHVSLNPKGVFTLNRRAYQALGSPGAAVLYFEKSTGVIGMSAAQPKLQEAFPFKEKQGLYWQLCAIPFCRHFGIRTDGTEVFVDPEVDDENILLLDLRTTRKVFGGKRGFKKRKAEAA
ncbi:hypothetical protein BH10ACI3_BH10ACI3_10000 [soil metagenome]